MPRTVRRTASSGLRGHGPRRRCGLEAARVAGVAVDELLLGLVRGEHDLVGVDHDDVVAGVEVGGEGRLVLAAQDAGHLGGQAAEHQALGVDDVPVAGDLAGLGAVGAHAPLPRSCRSPDQARLAPEAKDEATAGRAVARNSAPVLPGAQAGLVALRVGQDPEGSGAGVVHHRAAVAERPRSDRRPRRAARDVDVDPVALATGRVHLLEPEGRCHARWIADRSHDRRRRAARPVAQHRRQERTHRSMSSASMATSERVLARARRRARAGAAPRCGSQGRPVERPLHVVAVGARALAGSEVDVGVGGRRRRRLAISPTKAAPARTTGHEPRLDPLRRMRQSGSRAAGELADVSRSAMPSTVPGLSRRRATGTGPGAGRSARRPPRSPARRIARMSPARTSASAGRDHGADDASAPSGGRRRWPRSRSAARPSPRSVHAGPADPPHERHRLRARRRLRAAAEGGEVVLAEERVAGQASSSRSSGLGHVPRGAGEERIGHRPVQHRVAVGAARAEKRASKSRRPPPTSRTTIAGPQQLQQRPLQRRRGRRVGRQVEATRPGPRRARPGRCGRRRSARRGGGRPARWPPAARPPTVRCPGWRGEAVEPRPVVGDQHPNAHQRPSGRDPEEPRRTAS